MEVPGEYHIPVLLEEVIEGLQIHPTGTYVDATFGGGGHSKEILKRLGADGRLIAFDQEKKVSRSFQKRTGRAAHPDL